MLTGIIDTHSQPNPVSNEPGLYGLLLRSLPVPNAHRLARIRLISSAIDSRSVSAIPYRAAGVTDHFSRWLADW